MLFDKNLTITNRQVDYVAPSFGGGLNFRLSPDLMLNVQETFLYSTADNRDGSATGKNDAYLFHLVGLKFNFGNKKDADEDGISDRYDKCPNTPLAVVVDKNGYPLDKDKDGVADYLDEFPDVSGNEQLKGCPDKDGDYIVDKDDKCPDVAGITKLKGCPDADADGVTDGDDACLGTKPGYIVDAKGCAVDKDSDGVGDNQDRCPEVKGTMANKGCPEISKEDLKKITQIGSKIRLNGHLLGCNPCKLLNAIALGQIKAMNKKLLSLWV